MSTQNINVNFEAVVGDNAPAADGSRVGAFRAGRTREIIVADAHAMYREAVSRGRVNGACGQAAVTFGTGLTATAVTFTLYNPFGSGFTLSILQTGVTMVTSTTAGSLVYAANVNPLAAAPATNTELIVRNAKLDAGAGVAKVYSVTTLPAAPVAIRTLCGGFTTNANSFIRDHVNGLIEVAPGCCVTIQGITIVGTGIIDMVWEEIPIV